MEFCVLSRNKWVPDKGKSTIYLKKDNWNDHSFVTMFHMSIHDKNGELCDIGEIKIGFKGQDVNIETFAKLPSRFDSLGDEFFSLGQGVDFYRNMARLPDAFSKKVLLSLRDVVVKPDLIEEVKDEEVFSTSLLRNVSLSVVRGQYARVLDGKAELTDFSFKFVRDADDNFGGVDLSFNVVVGSTPSTNIHAIIGRNGVGKTTLLNYMIETITGATSLNSKFIDKGSWGEPEIPDDYFSSLVSVSFSAFDPFSPPREQPDPAKGTCYFYIGLKKTNDKRGHRAIDDLYNDCVNALTICFYDPGKTARWLNAIEKLGSDENFASMKLKELEVCYRDLCENIDGDEQPDSSSFRERYRNSITPYLSSMSSGHAIVLLTISRLVATVEEKTLILLDEPESHLHPPLLSAFLRALTDLLHDQNGVAIIATHSPVVLQEIPCSCVWKIYRVGSSITASRPTIETFGENVGVLTSEVFSLEVERSGFHDLLAKSVETRKGYEEIVDDYDGQLGFEGRAILKSLIVNRDRSTSHDANE